MKIIDLSVGTLRSWLSRGDLWLHMRPFVVRIRSNIPQLAEDLALAYGDFECAETGGFADFHIDVRRDRLTFPGRTPSARFFLDGIPHFTPLPSYQALAMLEWGLNWCIAAHCHQYLIFHAAVVEQRGRAAILPAPPGSGKSTLCAGLVNRGWRLLSDELALFDLDSGMVYGMARPINLKNQSIELMREFAPSAVITPPVPNTSKGTVALMRPPGASVLRASEGAQPTWIILPTYHDHAEAKLVPKSKAEVFMLMAEQSFNNEIHGVRGFNAMGELIGNCQCSSFTYSRLDDAIDVFAELLDEFLAT